MIPQENFENFLLLRLLLVALFGKTTKTCSTQPFARFDSEHVLQVRTLNLVGCSSSRARMNVRVWLHETSFHEWQRTRYNFFFNAYKNQYGHGHTGCSGCYGPVLRLR